MRVCPRCRKEYPTTERFCLVDNMVLVSPSDMSRMGTTVGNYHLHKILGRGGMGTVYQGEHVYIKKKVAVKVLHRQFAKYEEAVTRFLREARAASSINHPNIVDVTDFGPLDDGGVYFVMEYLEGTSLEDKIEVEGAIALHRALNIANQIGLALAAAHEKNIVHRDLKPDNIMLIKRPGRRDVVRSVSADEESTTGEFVIEREDVFDFVKVLDFGIAKVISPDELSPSQTIKGAVFGTPEYMSPEAARGDDVDSRADIYSLGVILFDMVCGRPPFEAQAAADVLTMHINHEPPVPSEFAPHREITRSADAVILKAMAKDIGERFQSMDDFRIALQECYGSVVYRRNANGIAGTPPRGREARTRRLTEELDEWLQSGEHSMSLKEARMLALVGNANDSFSEPLSDADEERLAAALDAALDDDD